MSKKNEKQKIEKKKILFSLHDHERRGSRLNTFGHRTQLWKVWLSSANVMRLEGEGEVRVWVTKKFVG